MSGDTERKRQGFYKEEVATKRTKPRVTRVPPTKGGNLWRLSVNSRSHSVLLSPVSLLRTKVPSTRTQHGRVLRVPP